MKCVPQNCHERPVFSLQEILLLQQASSKYKPSIYKISLVSFKLLFWSSIYNISLVLISEMFCALPLIILERDLMLPSLFLCSIPCVCILPIIRANLKLIITLAAIQQFANTAITWSDEGRQTSQSLWMFSPTQNNPLLAYPFPLPHETVYRIWSLTHISINYDLRSKNFSLELQACIC